MDLRLVTAATADVVTLAEAKAHLRVFHDDDDAYITALCSTFRDWISGERGWLGVDVVEQQWELSLCDFPHGDGRICLPRPPLKSVDSVVYTPSDGSAAVPVAGVRSFGVGVASGGYILPARDQDWPDTDEEPDSVKITFTAGYAAVPLAVKHAALLSVGHWYENREAATEAKLSDLPMAVDALLMPYRKWPV